eukprot:scaffold11510_cov84-Isochrysis_galbana.AAC.1
MSQTVAQQWGGIGRPPPTLQPQQSPPLPPPPASPYSHGAAPPEKSRPSGQPSALPHAPATAPSPPAVAAGSSDIFSTWSSRGMGSPFSRPVARAPAGVASGGTGQLCRHFQCGSPALRSDAPRALAAAGTAVAAGAGASRAAGGVSLRRFGLGLGFAGVGAGHTVGDAPGVRATTADLACRAAAATKLQQPPAPPCL